MSIGEEAVVTFIMLGKYSSEAMEGISGERTEKATAVIKNLGGQVTSMYALMGGYDLALIVEFPGVQQAMQASVALNRLTGVGFVTCPAIPVDEFDEMAAEAQ
jgi:uncharacterized protein with GYD domain